MGMSKLRVLIQVATPRNWWSKNENNLDEWVWKEKVNVWRLTVAESWEQREKYCCGS